MKEWRFKTKQEFIDQYGTEWKSTVNWNTQGYMNYLFGYVLTTEENEFFNARNYIDLKNTSGLGGYSIWNIDSSMLVEVEKLPLQVGKYYIWNNAKSDHKFTIIAMKKLHEGGSHKCISIEENREDFFVEFEGIDGSWWYTKDIMHGFEEFTDCLEIVNDTSEKFSCGIEDVGYFPDIQIKAYVTRFPSTHNTKRKSRKKIKLNQYD
jgi:hypothetical protein